ncbi:MAG: SMP-30/gluconolactonase/LRE family protein, partial [Vicinamibacteria bacterium]
MTRLDPELDRIVPPNPKLYKVAAAFTSIGGPVWSDGALCFSDPNENRIYEYQPDAGLAIFREKSGYDGADISDYGQPGSNGLALDSEGRLLAAEHGNRRISRIGKGAEVEVLANRYEGKRLDSPNDLVVKSDGSIYFSDPPFGLPGGFEDGAKELPFQGVYRLSPDGTLTLLTKELRAPNGIAFSPDEKTLYVSNAEKDRAVWVAFDVLENGSLGARRVFFDGRNGLDRERRECPMGSTSIGRENLFTAGPGGI